MQLTALTYVWYVHGLDELESSTRGKRRSRQFLTRCIHPVARGEGELGAFSALPCFAARMPAVVKVKVIRARDLPIMDRSSELTDAFVEVLPRHSSCA